MLWLCIVSVLVVIGAFVSIWGSIDDRRDMKTGHPSFESLLSYTGVWNRDTFVQILGDPDENDRFVLPADKIGKLPISQWTRFFDNIIVDIMSVLLAVLALILWTQNWLAAIGALATGAGLQVIGYVIGTIATYRSGIWRKWTSDEQR